ncbi:MAG: hypothetical protein KBB72_09295, partial [Candidatus Kapabacteria bacterium]|nr:hypothetical protein [Candidatus Kapabacteria bacterium]
EWYQPVPGLVNVEIYGSEGRFLQTLYTDRVMPGTIRVPVRGIASGSYICTVTVNGARTVVPLTVVK